MMEKILSVSVASYNIEKFIYQCLDSFVVPNVVEAVEVLIVNDGSTDSTWQIAKEYSEKYPTVFKVVDKPNGGWGSTVNAGLREAKGKYFKLLDGDDYFDNQHLIEFVDFLRKTSADVVFSPYTIFEDGSNKIVEEVGFSNNVDVNKESIFESVQLDVPIAMHACTFKRDLLIHNNLKITEKCFYTDVEYVLKALNMCKSVSFFEKTIYMYRIGRDGQSISIESLKRRYKEHLKVLTGMLDYEKKSLKKEYEPFYKERLKEMVTIQYTIFMALSPTKGLAQEIKSFDRKIKDEFPHYDTFKTKKMEIIRKLNYHGVGFISYLSQVKADIKHK